jgi:TRAP-type C4-dicarboxylate transport system permease small subunit
VVLKIVKRFLEVVVILLFVAIIVFTFAQVVTRYFPMNPFAWTEEISRLLLVWATYLGVSVVVANHDHIRVDFLLSRFPASIRRYDELFQNVVFLVFSVVMMYFGWIVAKAAWIDVSTALSYTRALFYLPIPVAGGFNLLFLVPSLVSSVRLLRAG